MAYATIEDRVDRLDALFGQFLTQVLMLQQRADERDQLAEERHQAAEQRHQAAEERHQAAEQRHQAAEERIARFEREMLEFRLESRADRRQMNRRWGDLANKLGTIIEDILVPNLRRLAREHFRFPSLDEFTIRLWRRHPTQAGGEIEIDTLVVGPEAILVGEAKSNPTRRDAEEFAAKLAQFADFFPEYKGRRPIGVLGSWGMDDRVVESLTALGIYAMRMGEETMELMNAAALEEQRHGQA